MHSIQEIRQKTTDNIEKIERLYSINLNDTHNLEYQNRVKNIKQKIIRSSTALDKKEELDLLLETIYDVDYLLSLHKEFCDVRDTEQLISESDFLAIEFGLLYLEYCLDISNIKNPEDYINNSLSPLEIISHIFISRSSGLYHVEMERLKAIIHNFNKMVHNANVLGEVITAFIYNFEKYQELKFKLSKSLQSIYSCLFILNEIRQERKKDNFDFSLLENKAKKSRNQKAIELLDSFIENGDTQEQKETWKAIKPGLMKNQESPL